MPNPHEWAKRWPECILLHPLSPLSHPFCQYVVFLHSCGGASGGLLEVVNEDETPGSARGNETQVQGWRALGDSGIVRVSGVGGNSE